MTQFTVKYLGKSMFTIISPKGHQLVNPYRCHSLSELEEFSIGYCSSWLKYSIKWEIDCFLTENNYRRVI